MNPTILALTLMAVPTQTICVHERSKLTWMSAGQNDEFGRSCDLHDQTLIVGAPRDKSTAGPGQGAAYVYTRTGSGWGFDAWLFAPDAAQGDRFGTTVTIDADTAIVGAPKDDGLGSQSVSAYVLTLNGCCWNFQSKLLPSDGGPNERFGDYQDFEGTFAVFGVPIHAGTVGSYSGAVYVFERAGTTWSQQAKLVASDAAVGDRFGTTVSLSGNWLAVGAPLDDDLGFSSGSVYLFEWTGTTWLERTKVLAFGGGPGDCFGAVSLVEDSLVVGAPGHDLPQQDCGAIYVFRALGSTWAPETILQAPSPAPFGGFGAILAFDGQTLACGLPSSTPATASTGSAVAFARQGSTWSAPLEFSASDAAQDDEFGASVLAAGDVVLVGAPLDDDNALNSGSIYEFQTFDAPISYCLGKTNSQGCVPFVSTFGSPSATDPQPFIIRGDDVVPQQSGFLIYAYKKANLAFHGGRLCVKAPFLRSPAKSPKNLSGMCTQAVLRFDFNKRIQGGLDPLLTSGQTIHAQWFQRDPADPAGFGDSLTDGVRFEICP